MSEIAVDSLIVDTDTGALPGRDQPGMPAENEIWITESSPGGNGLIEYFTEAYAQQTDQFFVLVEAALGPQNMS